MKRVLILSLLLITITEFSCTVDLLREEDFYYSGLPWTETDSWYTGFSNYRWAEDEFGWIFTELILPVPETKLPKAVKLLFEASVFEIDIEQAKFLLNQRSLDPNVLINSVIIDEEKEAKRREKESSLTSFAESSEKMKEWAAEHRSTAERARRLKGNLKPYLVRAVVLNEPTGAFSAHMKGEELWINHFILSRRPVPMKKWPIVIFLEKQPLKVYTSVSVAE